MPDPIRIPVASLQGCILASPPNALNQDCKVTGRQGALTPGPIPCLFCDPKQIATKTLRLVRKVLRE
jgi:hypothetical protein